MLNMSRNNHIKDLARNGKSQAEIVRETGRDAKTIRKYLAENDFSPKPPKALGRPSKLAPYKSTIDQWLESDKGRWHKQRHTAKRVYD